MYDYRRKDQDELLENQLEIRLHAIEIAELQRHRQNQEISQRLLDIRHRNQQQYQHFKTSLAEQVQSIIGNPVLWGTTLTGMLLLRSLVFGSVAGVSAYGAGAILLSKMREWRRESKVPDKC